MKSSYIVKDFCVEAENREAVLAHSMVPEIGSTYIVQSIDMTRSAANPDRFLVTVQLKVVAADEADTK